METKNIILVPALAGSMLVGGAVVGYTGLVAAQSSDTTNTNPIARGTSTSKCAQTVLESSRPNLSSRFPVKTSPLTTTPSRKAFQTVTYSR